MKRIAWLPGDGIGPEVCDSARRVLDAVNFQAEYLVGDVGWEVWRYEGDGLPDRTIDLLMSTDCAFFGAITSKPSSIAEVELAPDLHGKGLTYRSPVMRMRQVLDLYISLRPCLAIPHNPLNYRDDIDIVVFRENTEGLYVGVEFLRPPGVFYSIPEMAVVPRDAAISIRSISPGASRRIVEAAFEFAVQHGRRKVTAVHKANVLRATCGVFLETAQGVAQHYPDIIFETANIDAVCMGLLKRPSDYDVLVTTNLFGDILSDLGSQMVGGMGFAYTGNIGRHYAVFEPTHGSAPKYAGQDKVNPIAAILAAAMMLEWLGESGKALEIQDAVARVIADGAVRTYDMGGRATRTEMTDAIVTAIETRRNAMA